MTPVSSVSSVSLSFSFSSLFVGVYLWRFSGNFLIETDSILNLTAAVGFVQLVPKYISKVKLGRRQSPNILSEIIGS